jgi:hypothetical protein
MGHERPEWIDHLVLELEHEARLARQHASKLDRQKHAQVKGTYNTEAGLYAKFAKLLTEAWAAEESVAANLFDRFRVDVESLLVSHTVPIALRVADGAVVKTVETPIKHSELRILLAKYPRRFPDLEDDEETLT